MRIALRYTIRILVGIVALFLLLGIGTWIYLSLNKATVLKKVNTELSSRIRGEVSVKDLDIGFFRTFPKISIGLYGITVRDSLWKQHGHDLLKAEKVFASLNPFKLLSGRLTVDKIILEKASAYLITDSTGYNNAAGILRSRSDSAKNKPQVIPAFEIRDSRIVIEKKDRNKLFDFEINRLNCIVKQEENNLFLNTNLAMIVHSMAFNRKNGSFLEEKTVSGKFGFRFNPKSKILGFENIRLQVDHHPFTLTGKFFLDLVPATFTLSIKTEGIGYQRARSLLTANIRKKLDQYNIGKPFSINATLDATDPENRKPLIRIKMMVKDNTVQTPIADFSAVSFTGTFTNEWVHGQGRDDDNSILRFSSFTGQWQDLPFRCDTISISNLLHPLLTCDMHSQFNLTALNSLSEDKTIQFTKGNAKTDLVYRGPAAAEDSIVMERTIEGNISLDSGSVNYQPRNFVLSDCKGKIRFKNKNVYIDRLSANTGSSELNISGDIKNILTLMDREPGKISMDWNIASPKLNLKDFTPFLKKRSLSISRKKQRVLVAKAVSNFGSTLNNSDMHLELKAGQLIYKKFTASNLRASVLLTGDEMLLNNVELGHAGGSLSLKGSVANTGTENPVILHAQMHQVDINKAFYAFDNFGQDAIKDKNLKGKLDADINMSGMITDKATIVTSSLKGTIDFNLHDGALIHFEPVEKISQTAFKNRDFSDIRFAELKDRLEINGTEIKVNRMEINSTVLTMFVEGLYDLKKGADMSIQIPLSNLKSKNKDGLLLNKGVDSKTGLSVRLHAKTGDDGKLKISWDPFSKSLKKIRKKNQPAP